MPRGKKLQMQAVDAVIKLLYERTGTRKNGSDDPTGERNTTPDKAKPKPKERSIHPGAVAGVAECLELAPALHQALAKQIGKGDAKPRGIGEWLCAADTDIRAAVRHIRAALPEAGKALRREQGEMANLRRQTQDILGWMVVSTVMDGYQDENAELVKAWFDGIAFEIPLGRSPCLEVLTARWRGGKARFDLERPRYAYGEDDITPEKFQEIGFDDPTQPGTERVVEHVWRLVDRKFNGHHSKNKLSLTEKQELRARLQDDLEFARKRLRLVIDRDDLDSGLAFRPVVEAIHAALPQLHLIFVHSGREPDPGIFVVPADQLAAAVQGLLDELKKLP